MPREQHVQTHRRDGKPWGWASAEGEGEWGRGWELGAVVAGSSCLACSNGGRDAPCQFQPPNPQEALVHSACGEGHLG